MSQEGQDDGPADYGEVVGRSFLDKLLLAVIDAHMTKESNLSAVAAERARMERLADAKMALLGETPPEGRPPNPDEAVLRWMGDEHYRDLGRRDSATMKGEPPSKARSDRQLADQAVKKFELPDNAVERLRRKFGRQRQKWLEVAMEHDDVPETLDHGLLLKIRDKLAKDSIAMNLDRVERNYRHSRTHART